MNIRTYAAAAAVATVLAVPLAGVASAQTADRDCPDFASQAEAQAALLPGDPERLDDDDDGQACEDYDYGPAAPAPGDDDGDDDGQVSVVPRGGVDTGDGSSSQPPALFVLGGAAALGVAAAAGHRAVRRSH